MYLYFFSNDLTLSVLREGRLPLTPLTELNDPFLSTRVPTLEKSIAGLTETDFQSELKRQYENMPDHLKSMIGFDYFRKEAAGKRRAIEQQVSLRKFPPAQEIEQNLAKQLGMAAFFEDISEPFLWDKYGARHQGIALRINLSQTVFLRGRAEGQPQFCKAVTYAETRPRQTTGTDPLLRFSPVFYNSLVLKQEREWRMIRPLAAAGKKHEDRSEPTSVKFPGAALEAIIFGSLVSGSRQEAISKYTRLDMRYSRAELWTLQKDPVIYKLRPVALPAGNEGAAAAADKTDGTQLPTNSEGT